MFERISPEQAGIPSRAVLKFIKTLEGYKLNTHSIIMSRGDKIFSECYYAPFDKDFKHRMSSVSKSFVGVAVGLLIEDGRMRLSAPLMSYLPEYMGDAAAVGDSCYLSAMTVEDALEMQTCKSKASRLNWLKAELEDRAESYFKVGYDRPSGAVFEYDSQVSFLLGVIVEKITGMPFLDFLKERFLTKCGFSEDSHCLKCPGGHSFGDSGVLCSARDLLIFARFVMNGGTWEGVRYMDEGYLREATSKKTASSIEDYGAYDSYGYGYQIWKAPRDGFAFIGMGDQLAICDRLTDFIFIINSDNRGYGYSRTIIYHALYDYIVEALGEPLPENPADYGELLEYEKSRRLCFASGDVSSPFADEISGVTFALDGNPMGITRFKLDFCGDEGVFSYTNGQGDKELRFGFGKNIFQMFPQYGYPDEVMTVSEPNHRYGCAVSAEWREEKKLHLKVQLIDKHFGVLDILFSFKGDGVLVAMEKTAESILDKYCGYANGRSVEALC